MPLMRMMQVTFDEIVGMTAVWYRLVSATRAVRVLIVVRSTAMRRRTSGRIRSALCQGMFVHVTLMGTVKMSFVQIVDVTLMFDCGVAAAWTVRVGMLVMRFVVAHVTCLLVIMITQAIATLRSSISERASRIASASVAAAPTVPLLLCGPVTSQNQH